MTGHEGIFESKSIDLNYRAIGQLTQQIIEKNFSENLCCLILNHINFLTFSITYSFFSVALENSSFLTMTKVVLSPYSFVPSHFFTAERNLLSNHQPLKQINLHNLILVITIYPHPTSEKPDNLAKRSCLHTRVHATQSGTKKSTFALAQNDYNYFVLIQKSTFTNRT